MIFGGRAWNRAVLNYVKGIHCFNFPRYSVFEVLGESFQMAGFARMSKLN